MQDVVASANLGVDVIGSHRAYRVLNTVMRQQAYNTAISILPLPSLPAYAESKHSAAVDPDWIGGVSMLTDGCGPVVLAKAVPGSQLITVEL